MQIASLLLTLSAITGSAAQPTPDTVVVCPSEFRDALAPWLDLRKSQGRMIRIVSNEGTPEQIRERIRAAARQGKLRFAVLVGGADPAMNADPAVRRRSIPTHLERAKVIDRWGPDTEI
ncbi:MAG TPA: hypothetical protein VG056_17445, partial [Pirellulales bacterium]|nr:hypothetical protein [Pirellulales bacterium]